MKCALCGRLLLDEAAAIGRYRMGPVCARKAGLLPPRRKQRARIIERHFPVPVDPRQLTLELAP